MFKETIIPKSDSTFPLETSEVYSISSISNNVLTSYESSQKLAYHDHRTKQNFTLVGVFDSAEIGRQLASNTYDIEFEFDRNQVGETQVSKNFTLESYADSLCAEKILDYGFSNLNQTQNFKNLVNFLKNATEFDIADLMNNPQINKCKLAR